MFIPLYDRNPLKSIAFYYVTSVLIAVNTLTFLVSLVLGEGLLVAYGMIPAVLLSPSTMAVEAPTLITYAFLHAGWMHLIGNMLFLWVFGDNVEDALGHLRFLVLYVMCGVAGALAHALMNASDYSVLVGASGAISGVAAAYLVLFPKAKVFGLLMLYKIPIIGVPAAIVLGLWIAFQVFAFLASGVVDWIDPNASFEAHLGGIIVGVLLVKRMAKNLLPSKPTDLPD